jgi:hypothetical protein
VARRARWLAGGAGEGEQDRARSGDGSPRWDRRRDEARDRDGGGFTETAVQALGWRGK